MNARRVVNAVAPFAGIVLFLVTWQAVVKAFSIERFVLPAPSAVFSELWHNPGRYFHNGWITVWWSTIGFVVALISAVAVASVMAHSRLFERAMLPLAVLVQVTPIVAYAPALAIWLKTLSDGGRRVMIVVTAIVCFVPFLINATTGLKSIDPATHELLRSVNASRREIFFKLRVPHALPYLFSAARIGVGLALIGAVLGEWYSLRTTGLGSIIQQSQRNTQGVPAMWAAVFVLATIGGTAIILLTLLERIMLRWHSSQRSR